MSTNESEVRAHENFAPVLDRSTALSTYIMVETQANFLLGKVLTTIDACLVDREQKKAVKDLIRQQFRAQLKHIEGILSDNTANSVGGESVGTETGGESES